MGVGSFEETDVFGKGGAGMYRLRSVEAVGSNAIRYPIDKSRSGHEVNLKSPSRQKFG